MGRKKSLFFGCGTAIVTPFSGGVVDYLAFGELIEQQISGGADAVVILGTTGEAPTIYENERSEIISFAKRKIGSRVPLIVGTGSNATSVAVRYTKAAEALGADGCLVVSPYYNKATSKGLVAHYITIAKSVKIPIIMYNVPTRTGVDIPVEVYQQLSYIENIAGIKEASSDITKIAKIHNACKHALPVWSGNDDQIVPVIAMGGCGVISVLSNIVPVETQAMAQAALNGDFDTASALQCKMLPLIDALFSEVNPIPVKAAMKEIGYDCGNCRLPLCTITDSNLLKLQSLLN